MHEVGRLPARSLQGVQYSSALMTCMHESLTRYLPVLVCSPTLGVVGFLRWFAW